MTWRRSVFGFCLILPALVFTVALVISPIARTFWMSLHDLNLSRPQRMHAFVGFAHYQALFSDARVWFAIGVTLTYSGIVTVTSYVIGLGLALLLNERARGIWLGRTLLALPWAVPGVVATFVFLWMFDASFGVVNYVLMRAGIISSPVPWASYPQTAMFLVALIGIWKIIPFVMLTQLAGLQSIPGELYQAAEADGAGRFQAFRYVTWPGLSHVRVVTVILTGLVTFREFGQIFVATGGGPERATETLSVKIYIEAFQNFKFGYASALGVLMLAISLVFTVLVKRSLSSRHA
jgi:multiple sugar transport system permease protein